MPRRPPAPQFVGMESFHPLVREWFAASFSRPTDVQSQAWPVIARRAHTLLLAPTGSGKTLAAFLVALDRLMFPRAASPPTEPLPATNVPAVAGVRALYISPLKALGVDIARNLRSPLDGIREHARRAGQTFHEPRIAIRSGDTPSSERARFPRQPPDILITTPESLYLLLTSRASRALASVESVIVDEIHALVANKRGAHLFVSLERLETLRQELRPGSPPLQRIGLSATQRPLDEVASLLGGAEYVDGQADHPRPRPVEIIAAGSRKLLDITIEMPALEQQRPTGSAPVGPFADADSSTFPEESASRSPRPPSPDSSMAPSQGSPTEAPLAVDKPSGVSIWPAIYPQLVERIRAHRSTMLFVNSRRLAERLATAINELAGEPLAMAHHGSIAKDQRQAIEERLKSGRLPAIVATSSLELGIDMGAVDLVIQIAAPPSIAAGLQRIGRAGHQVGAPSTGVVFPKYRGDLLACAAAAARMISGQVEETRFPRNPLDVLAQQLVAIVSMVPRHVDELFALVRRAAPFHELPRGLFDGVLDMLAGRYPSDDFSELRPRVTWDRIQGIVTARQGAQRLAIANAGTIPDRGLYGVFLADRDAAGTRVGELDEEMVFETKVGDIILLGASSWEVREITHDRVLVVPAPGAVARLPFWRGEGPGRPLEFGRAIGRLTREIVQRPADAMLKQLTTSHGLTSSAARQLLEYVTEQTRVAGTPPSDETIVIESFRDEVGDWRIALLSPFGMRVHAPWALAAAARIRHELPGDHDVIWDDDGIVFRLPSTDEPPPAEWFLPSAEDVESLVARELAGSSLFAARFRENAGRALLLPRRLPGRRTPLWLQRRRSANLLQAVSKYPGFPLLLETYRECLRDVFDLPGLQSILRDVERRAIQVRSIESSTASPFASALLFNYAGNFIYEEDTPLAERRVHALAIDFQQLRELLGDAPLRQLLDPQVIADLTRELQRLDQRRPVRHADHVHDLLLGLGDLSHEEILHRGVSTDLAGELDVWLDQLTASRRVTRVMIAGEPRYIAVEHAGRYRDALGVELPSGLPDVFLEATTEPLVELVGRYARTRGPFTEEELAGRYGWGIAVARDVLVKLELRGRVVPGEFTPTREGREWCDVDALETLRRRSLIVARRRIEPVDETRYARFLANWQGVARPKRGLDGLLDAVEQLQGLPLPMDTLDDDILPARVSDYEPSDLDELCSAGEVVWQGWNDEGARDRRVALYLTDSRSLLAPVPRPLDEELAQRVRQLLAERGALFFPQIAKLVGGFRNDVQDALWRLVWNGEVTNDSLAPVRSLRVERDRDRRAARGGRAAQRFRTRRTMHGTGAEGRWSLIVAAENERGTPVERQMALVTQLLKRYGIVMREVAIAEAISGGFSSIYPLLKAMEEAGRVRRGYYVAGRGAAQFTAAGADELLRRPLEIPDPTRSGSGNQPGNGLRDSDQPEEETVLVLSALDPANPYGTLVPWPQSASEDVRPQRVSGALVFLHLGRLLGYLNKAGEQVIVFGARTYPDREHDLRRLARALAAQATEKQPVFLTKVDGREPGENELSKWLMELGFVATSRGYLLRRRDAN